MIYFPIYIPTKGRAKHCLTANILTKEHIKFYLVVEPQDYKDYSEHYPKEQILILNTNDRGIAYARNFCKLHSIQNQYSAHWQIDDNIKSFRERINNKNIKTLAMKLLASAESFYRQYSNIGICGLRHTCFAFSQKKFLSLNQQIYSCFLVNNSVPILWRDGLIEDTDYSLQVLYKRQCTVLFNTYLIEKATTMSMPGGNTEISHGGDGRLKRSIGLCQAWPGIFEMTRQYNRVKIKPSRIWNSFPQKLLKK